MINQSTPWFTCMGKLIFAADVDEGFKGMVHQCCCVAYLEKKLTWSRYTANKQLHSAILNQY